MTVLAPGSLDALAEAVATGAPAPLQVAGGGTTRPWPSPDALQAPHVLDMRALSGISTYDPAECVITVGAGTPVAEVAGALAAHGQYLPWDPPIAGPGATIGGMVASGVSGPGRYRYGGVRDFVIGARFVDGRGRLVTSGGQVVKNAAGFLMHHALVGSAGRLGVIAEVSLKVFPRPEATRTLVARTGSLPAALAAHERLRLANLDLDALDVDATSAEVSARLAGAAAAIDDRTTRARRALALAADVLTDADAARHWTTGSVAAWPLAGATVKVPTTPTRLVSTLETLQRLGPCRISVGGAVAYVHTAHPVAAIDAALTAGGLTGTIVRGAEAGTRVGLAGSPAFLSRVRATVDPDTRFR